MTIDTRLHAYRDDLADEGLRGRVEAARFVTPRSAHVTAPTLDLRAAPSPDAGLMSQALYGDALRVFEVRDGWAWVQRACDGYVGYAPADGLREGEGAPSHIVTAPRTFLYAEPDLKRPMVATLSMGSHLAVTGTAETRGTAYVETPHGFAFAGHVAPLGEAGGDWVDWAAGLLGTPYLWGGISALGLDCSGLVTLGLRMVGRDAPRDSDMQAEGLGEPIALDEVRRGALVFWRGHVGIMEDEETLLHANGHTMNVARESLAEAVERIGYLYARPTGARLVAL